MDTTEAAKNVSIKEAADIMRKSQQFVRVGLQLGKLPFGTAIKTSSKWSYYINPAQFNKYIGDTQGYNKE